MQLSLPLSTLVLIAKLIAMQSQSNITFKDIIQYRLGIH